MSDFTDEQIDEIRRGVFVGAEETAKNVARHRASIRKAVAVTAAERAKGRSDDFIRRAMANAARHQMAADGITEDSPRYETEVARAARSVDAVLALLRQAQSGSGEGRP